MDFFKKQAASYFSSQGEKKEEEVPSQAGKKHESQAGEGKKHETQAGEGNKDEIPSYQELMGSANVLLDAAKSQMGGNKEGNKEGKPDTAKLADAAEDVLQAASHYGKLKGTPYEGYVKKAEDYLQQYQSRDGADLVGSAEEFKKSGEDVKARATSEEAFKPSEETVEALRPKRTEE